MRFTVITPNYNGAPFLEQTIRSVLKQNKDVDLEYIVIDGGSTDGSLAIINDYVDHLAHCIIEKDQGPASAINKGLRLATGDIVSWLNADDLYYPGTLARVRETLHEDYQASMCFGGCPIINEQGEEIRQGITRFKELFYPLSCRFTYQCINYLSQPALFFRKSALEKVGLLREDMTAAWDYEFILRLWRHGPARRITGAPLAAFRWHPQSISGRNFQVQFQEEYTAAKHDAGRLSLQTALHFLVCWGIIGVYQIMSQKRSRAGANR